MSSRWNDPIFIKEYNRQYRERNQEKLKEEKRRHYKLNAEETKLKVLLWRKKNPEKLQQQRIKHREKRKEHRKAVGKEYREKNKLRIKEYSRLAISSR